MVIDMNETRIRSIEQVRDFLAGTLDIEFLPPDVKPETQSLARYALIFIAS